MHRRRWLATIAAVAVLTTTGGVSPATAGDETEIPKNDSNDFENVGLDDADETDDTGPEPGPDQSYDFPPGQWTGTVAFSGTRQGSGLSAVGQPTQINEQVDGATIEIVVQIGDGERSGLIESGTANVSIGHSEIGTFSSSVTSETGGLSVEGDLTHFELHGTLTRDLSAWDADGNFIDAVSYPSDIDVRWTFDLVDAECGAFEYELTDARGASLISWAARPNQEQINGFDFTHDLSVGALLGAPGDGPSLFALQNAVAETEMLVAGMVRNPEVQQIDELLEQIRDIEQLYTQYIESQKCLAWELQAMVEQSKATLRQLLTDLITVLLEQDTLETSVLVTVFTIAVRVGAIAPGIEGGPGQDLLDLTVTAVQSDLADAIEAEDLDLILKIMAWAAQYGIQELVDDAQAALDLGIGQ